MSAEPNRRATLVDEICERTGITEAMIAELVDTFYGRVREDSLLAPRATTLSRLRDSSRLMTGSTLTADGGHAVGSM